MRLLLTVAMTSLLTIGIATTAQAQEVVVEEIRPAAPVPADIAPYFAPQWDDPDGPRFDGSDLMPAPLEPKPKPTPADTSAVPDHVVPRPLVAIPH